MSDDIITPKTFFDGLNVGLELKPQLVREEKSGDITIQYIYIFGRDAGEGKRVKFFAAFAFSGNRPSDKALLYLPDSARGIDTDVLLLFANRGFSVLMIDYRGAGLGEEHYTRYPESISYANVVKTDRHGASSGGRADRSCWFEWCAVALYGREFLEWRTGSKNIAVVGVRDGGEIAWKAITNGGFSCAVTVSAAGWDYCRGFRKFENQEPELDEERRRYVAGIDSHAYAPYVKCPVMMLCTVNDPGFDCDRAYDTFSRINPEYSESSSILYSLPCTDFISYEATENMFLFLENFVAGRQIFVPEPSGIEIVMDEEKNLVACITSDPDGQMEHCDLFYAEDETDFKKRHWTQARFMCENAESGKLYFGLDVFRETRQIFVFARARYSNGFTVWSKIYGKKISGLFRNSKPACKVLFYSGDEGDVLDGFSAVKSNKTACGGLFVTDAGVYPKITERDGHLGITAPGGFLTWKPSSKRFSPRDESVLKLDVYTDEAATVTVEIYSSDEGETYRAEIKSLGGVWQGECLDAKKFKTHDGKPLLSMTSADRVSVLSENFFCVNNMMWI
ncbi:MAG: hypothetical protein LUD47_02860 [Clostridia bacterium]|nr:hypothetical protein [Clostridia bacterium]